MNDPSKKISDFFDHLWGKPSFMTEILASLLWYGIIAAYLGATAYIAIMAFLIKDHSFLESAALALSAPLIGIIAAPIGYVVSLPAIIFLGPPSTLLLIKLGQFTQIKMAMLCSAVAFSYSLICIDDAIGPLSPAFLFGGFFTGWLSWNELKKKEI